VLGLVVSAACGTTAPLTEDSESTDGFSTTMSSEASSEPATSTGFEDATTTTGPEDATTTTTDAETSSTTGSSSGTESSSSGGGSTGEYGDCVPFSIDDLAPADFEPGLTTYETDATTAIGGELPDRFQLAFYSGATGLFDLASAGVNDNYQTCLQCLRVMEDLDAADFLQRWYFQVAGTIEIENVSNPMSGEVHATLEDVVLVEVGIDPKTWMSTPLEDGQCLRLDSPLEIDVVP
jgi:hypothetical protein